MTNTHDAMLFSRPYQYYHRMYLENTKLKYVFTGCGRCGVLLDDKNDIWFSSLPADYGQSTQTTKL